MEPDRHALIPADFVVKVRRDVEGLLAGPAELRAGDIGRVVAIRRLRTTGTTEGETDDPHAVEFLTGTIHGFQWVGSSAFGLPSHPGSRS